MNRVIVFTVAAVVGLSSAAMADSFGTGANQFTIDFVPISGDAGSVNGSELGFGRTFNDPDDFRMGVYEVMNDQWDKFKAQLGVPVTGSPSSAYNENTYWPGAGVAANRTSFYEAAQFANWLNTSTGHQAAYKFTGTQGTGDYALDVWSAAEAAGGTNIYRHKNARYFIPTESEWAKAAYWNGTSMQTWATKNNAAPQKWAITGGPNSDGQMAGWNYNSAYGIHTGRSQPWPVTAGYSPQELNGTFDMMGNQREWTETSYNYAVYGVNGERLMRGGDYGGAQAYLKSNPPLTTGGPAAEARYIGFRVAAVPVDKVLPGDNRPAETGGGSDTVGGIDFHFEEITAGGVLTGQYKPTPIDELSPGDIDAVNFLLPSDPLSIWAINFGGQFEGTVMLTFCYDDSNLLIPEAYLAIWHKLPSGVWEMLPVISHDMDANTLTVTTTSFSDFALGAVPEPATLSLLALGSLALLRRRRRSA